MKLQVVQLDSSDRQELFLSFIIRINWFSKNINTKVLTLSFFLFCPKHRINIFILFQV